MAATYKSAGVDVEAADKVKSRIADLAASTHGPEVLTALGGFGGLYQLAKYESPVLVSGTDNVGTKLKIAIAMESYQGLGEDVVNACVNDVITSGAKPLFFLDYIATGQVDSDLTQALITGVVKACRENGCALIGGETSELPGLFAPKEFDLSGFAVGVVEKDEILAPESVRQGDILIGLPSTGLHTNGYSLVRHVLDINNDPSPLFQYHESLGCTLGEALLQPHRAYFPLIEPIISYVKSIAHITGGGLSDNLPRALPKNLCADIEKQTWTVPPVFEVLRDLGVIDSKEMYRVFNMGLGMVLICDEGSKDAICTLIPDATVVGSVVERAIGARVVLH